VYIYAATADICLQLESVQDRVYPSIGVTSGAGAGLCGMPGEVVFRGSGRGYAGSWI
jgi:hypothetical protein